MVLELDAPHLRRVARQRPRPVREIVSLRPLARWAHSDAGELPCCFRRRNGHTGNAGNDHHPRAFDQRPARCGWPGSRGLFEHAADPAYRSCPVGFMFSRRSVSYGTFKGYTFGGHAHTFGGHTFRALKPFGERGLPRRVRRGVGWRRGRMRRADRRGMRCGAHLQAGRMGSRIGVHCCQLHQVSASPVRPVADAAGTDLNIVDR